MAVLKIFPIEGRFLCLEREKTTNCNFEILTQYRLTPLIIVWNLNLSITKKPSTKDNSEFEIEEDAESITEVPPAEGAFGKYLREYRLLNSLLLSLGIIVGIIGFMLAWTIVVQVGEEGF